MDPEADTPGGSTPQPTLNAEAGPSQPRRIAKPKGGEVKWWNTSVEVDKDGNRDKYYGWTDSGGMCQELFAHQRETDIRRRVWRYTWREGGVCQVCDLVPLWSQRAWRVSRVKSEYGRTC